MLIVCFAAFSLAAQDYYVSSENGSDSNTGLSVENAFATINRGIAAVSAGGTVFVMEGEYRDENANTPVVSFYEDTNGLVDSAGNSYVYNSGSDLNNPHVVTINKAGNAVGGYITLKNYPNHTPKIFFNGQGGIKLGADANYIIVEGFEIEGPSQSINYSQAIMNRRNRITLNEKDGIRNNNLSYFSGKGIWGGYDAHHHVIIRNNIVHDTPGSGIRFNDSDHITIENNTVYNTTWWTSSASSAIVFAETIATTDGNDASKIASAADASASAGDSIVQALQLPWTTQEKETSVEEKSPHTPNFWDALNSPTQALPINTADTESYNEDDAKTTATTDGNASWSKRNPRGRQSIRKFICRIPNTNGRMKLRLKLKSL